MKRKIIVGAVPFVVLVTILGLLPMSMAKRFVPPNAIAFSYVGSTNALGEVSVLLTNTTGKKLLLSSIIIETRVGNQFINQTPLERGPHVDVIAPYSWLLLPIEVASLPADRPWRLRMDVLKEVKGAERTVRVLKGWDRTPRPAGLRELVSPFFDGYMYFGHATNIFSQDFSSPTNKNESRN